MLGALTEFSHSCCHAAVDKCNQTSSILLRCKIPAVQHCDRQTATEDIQLLSCARLSCCACTSAMSRVAVPTAGHKSCCSLNILLRLYNSPGSPSGWHLQSRSVEDLMQANAFQ